MRRRLLNFLTGLSLVLFVALVGLWVHSFGVGDCFYLAKFREGGPWTYWVRNELHVWSGQVGFTHSVSSGTHGTFRASIDRDRSRRGADPPFHRQVDPDSAAVKLGNKAAWLLGFGIAHSSYVRQDGSTCAATDHAVAPLWPFAAVLGTLPAVRFVLMSVKRAGPLAGICPRCGYDLRATPGRCPECGAVPLHSKFGEGLARGRFVRSRRRRKSDPAGFHVTPP